MKWPVIVKHEWIRCRSANPSTPIYPWLNQGLIHYHWSNEITDLNYDSSGTTHLNFWINEGLKTCNWPVRYLHHILMYRNTVSEAHCHSYNHCAALFLLCSQIYYMSWYADTVSTALSQKHQCQQSATISQPVFHVSGRMCTKLPHLWLVWHLHYTPEQRKTL